jgi:hypothetical protein
MDWISFSNDSKYAHNNSEVITEVFKSHNPDSSVE